MTCADTIALLREILEEIAPPALVSAYLFGSRSEGRSHRASDVDIGVLLRWDACPTARDRFRERVRLSALLPGRLGGRRADVVILNDAPAELGRRIVTSGRRILCADPEVDHAFVRDVQLRAADLAPFLRRMRRIKLQAIARR